MRIAVVTIVFPAASEAFAAVEFRKIVQAGHEVSVYAVRSKPFGSQSSVQPPIPAGVAVSWQNLRTLLNACKILMRHPIKVGHTLWWTIRHGSRTPALLLKCLVFFPRLMEIGDDLARACPDVVHLFWGHYPSVAGYYAKLRMPSASIYSTSLGAYDLLYNFGPSTDFARQSDVIWTHASVNRPMLESRGIPPSRIRVLPRGIDLGQVPDGTAIKQRGLIAVVARLVPEKGVEVVIRAFNEMRQSKLPCNLEIVGDGPSRRTLERLVESLQLQSFVRFHGNVSHDEVFNLLSRADVFILASTNPSERLPNVVKEALACRCVCIVSPTPGIEELLATLQHQLIVSPRVDSLSSALADVLRFPEKYSGDRDSGRQHVFANYDAGRVAEERLSVWREAREMRAAMTGAAAR